MIAVFFKTLLSFAKIMELFFMAFVGVGEALASRNQGDLPPPKRFAQAG
jgi:hypothetical protein